MAKKKPRAPSGYSFVFAHEAARIGATLDTRGLFPLERARTILAATTAYERDGDPNGDVIWASLLSLEDGAEFCREASRLVWAFPHLRGWDNEDAVRRYGAAALPWLESMLDRRENEVGSIPAIPYHFVGTHLLATGGEAVHAILRVRRDSDPDPDQLGFVSDWLARHETPAWGALARLAIEGDPAARRALDALARRSPSGVRKKLVTAIGREGADRALPGKTAKLDASAILAVLDAAASAEIGDRLPWPTLKQGVGHFEYHAMRVYVVRAKKGDDWGILIEVVQGDILGPVRWPATIQQYTYGSKVASGGVYIEDVCAIDVVSAPVDPARAIELDLRAGMSNSGSVEDWQSVLSIRHRLAIDPASFLPSPSIVLAKLGLPRAAILLETSDLEHVDGPMHGKDTLARLPSASIAWRSIAEVIVTRDASRFQPGEPNTAWRLHATKKQY